MFGPLEQFEIVTLFYNFYYIKLDVSSVFVNLYNWISLFFLSCPENINLDKPFYLPFNLAFVFLLHYGLAANESFLQEGFPVVINNFIFLFFNNFILSFWFFFFIVFFFAYQLFFQNNIILRIWLFCFQQFCQFIQQIINNLLINFKGKFYFFFLLFCLFFFLSFLNLLGLIPYSFAITSYFSITFLFAFIFFFTFFFLGFFYHGLKILNLFLPAGTPVVIMPLLILIEFISYFTRVFSLSIRLFANITAGHILLKILSWFVFLLFNIFFISFSGFFLLCILWFLEFFIAILQAYVFLILLCIYCNEILALEH